MIQAFGSTAEFERRVDPGRSARQVRIAVLLLCFNEGGTIDSVVADFHAAMPEAGIYVYDNNSTYDTIEKAEAAGAIVRRESQQGKSHVVRRMDANVEANVYVLVDGDDTYDASASPDLVARLISDGLDMVTAKRVAISTEAYRFGHVFGNRLLTGLAAGSFGRRVTDLLSGYRVLSRRFVKSFTLLTGGFEIETELTVHALELGMPQAEIETPYRERPADSASKLNTYRDGLRILNPVSVLIKK